MEKALTMYGNPENCKNVCRDILETMQRAATYTNKNINDVKGIRYERMITLKGIIENMFETEAQISAKRRKTFENDHQSMASQNGMLPRLRPITVMSATGITYLGHDSLNDYQPFAYHPMYPSTIPPINPALAADVQETGFLFIPNSAVGAIIGTKGTNIHSMIRFSGESIYVASIESEILGPSDDMNSAPQTSQKVTIGTAETQWRAQGTIFDKLLDEGFISATEGVRLTVEILVPSSQVGSLICPGGSNIRELQRATGSIIKLPTQGSTDGMVDIMENTTTVHIIGRFLAIHSAQSRIRSMVATGVNPVPIISLCNSSPTETP